MVAVEARASKTTSRPPQSCRSKRVGYQISHPLHFLAMAPGIFPSRLRNCVVPVPEPAPQIQEPGIWLNLGRRAIVRNGQERMPKSLHPDTMAAPRTPGPDHNLLRFTFVCSVIRDGDSSTSTFVMGGVLPGGSSITRQLVPICAHGISRTPHFDQTQSPVIDPLLCIRV